MRAWAPLYDSLKIFKLKSARAKHMLHGKQTGNSTKGTNLVILNLQRRKKAFLLTAHRNFKFLWWLRSVKITSHESQSKTYNYMTFNEDLEGRRLLFWIKCKFRLQNNTQIRLIQQASTQLIQYFLTWESTLPWIALGASAGSIIGGF